MARVAERRYDCREDKPQGTPEDPMRCVAEVQDGRNWPQCPDVRGFGPDGLYCRKHGEQEAERRRMVS